jgi:cobalt-zinc-cadmium efflux system membrane fusion protein
MSSLTERIGTWSGYIGRALAVLVVVLVAGGAAAWLASTNTHPTTSASGEKKEPDSAPKLLRTGTNEVVVPTDVQASLNIKTAAVVVPTRKRKLPAFQGKLNFDNSRFARIQSPFPGPIVGLPQVPEPVVSAAQPPVPTWKVGDKVDVGDVLAVVWSADLGAKKSDFLDALSRLKTDEETYQRYLADYQSGGMTFTERSVREAERTVQSDRVAVERAEATLRAWRVPADEIKVLRTEAEQLTTPNAKRTDPAKWARVEIKAPISGRILEKSVTMGQVVDTTTDLFRIGDLTTLAVWVHVFEDDLPLLRGVALPAPWVVSAPAEPGWTFHGHMEQIAAALDPTQQTALVTGTVENPRGELRAGMGVSVTLELPPTTGELEVPAEAVIEDGRESYVFVRPGPTGDKFVRTPVTVVRRSRDVIAIVDQPGGLKVGTLVVTSGSLLLGDAFSELPQPKSEIK